MRRSLRWALAGCLVFFAASGSAMRVRSSASVRGWSKDGSAVLIEIDQSGPEGGGARYLRLLESTGAVTDALVSDDMSPGDGSRPQRVSPAKCAEVTRPLVARLAQLGFEGLGAGKDGCGISGAGVEGRALQVQLSGGQALIFDGKRSITRVAFSESDQEPEAFASPSGRAMIVLSNLGEPVLAFYSSPGALAQLALVRRK